MPTLRLDRFAASPVGDHDEFKAAFERFGNRYPNITKDKVTYVGTDGEFHYFQRWGDTTEYRVPVTAGWSPVGKFPRPLK